MRLMNKIESMLDTAFDKHRGKDEVVWEGGLQMTAQGPGIAVVSWMPGGIIGSAVTTALMVGNPNTMTEDDAEQVARTMLEQMRQARSRQLQETMAPTNGDAGPPENPARLQVPGQ